ncbi:MAG: TlpA disulfide reductase family protein [Pseudomonadota bacterium]
MNVQNAITPKRLLAVLIAIGAISALYVIFSATGNPVQKPATAVSAPAGFVLSPNRPQAPKAPFLSPEGETVALQDFAGDVLLVNIWATWCAPCLKEMPSLDRLQAAYADAPFRVLAVSIDAKGQSVAQEFLDRLDITTFAAYSDPRAAFAVALGADAAVPTTVLIGADGREVGRLVGPADWSAEPARRLIAKALSETAKPD